MVRNTGNLLDFYNYVLHNDIEKMQIKLNFKHSVLLCGLAYHLVDRSLAFKINQSFHYF